MLTGVSKVPSGGLNPQCNQWVWKSLIICRCECLSCPCSTPGYICEPCSAPHSTHRAAKDMSIHTLLHRHEYDYLWVKIFMGCWLHNNNAIHGLISSVWNHHNIYIHTHSDTPYSYMYVYTYVMVIAQPKQVNQKDKGAFIGTHYIFIYILWWLHNQINLSIARWSHISDVDFWTKMALFREVFSGKRFVCCTPTHTI